MRGVNKAGAIGRESIEAFWAKVEIGLPRECWLWSGALNSKGYGNVRVNSVYMKAHRLAWTVSNFEIPDGFIVCHACDTPACCNPSHLMLGRPLANFIDMVKKSRGEFRKNKAIGTRNTNAKLSESSVALIRAAYKNKTANQYELADQYGVSQPAIGAVIRNETWRHV